MALFQKPASTPEEIEISKPLEMPPEDVLQVDEDTWYSKVYRGDTAPQLTIRAIVMGVVLGFFLAFTNVYIGLKAGWHLGVALTACILSFSIWTFFVKVGAAASPMSILENNCMQSTASAAGYATGGTLISAVPALLLLSVTPENPGGTQLPWPVAFAWTFFLGALGTVLAIPMKRNLINQERLRFPSGTAAAVTLQGLYSHGASAIVKARALFYAALVSGVVPLIKDLNLVRHVSEAGKVTRDALIPGSFAVFNWLPGISAAGKKFALSDWNIKLDIGPALIAAGALIGVRVTASMILGGLVLAIVIGPIGMEASWVNPLGKSVMAVTKPGSAWREIGLWTGAPLLVSAGLLSFAMQWRTIGRAFSGLRKKSGEGAAGAAAEELRERTEVPGSWFVGGTLVSGSGVIFIVWRYFQVPIYYGVLAVAMTFVLALVACRTTGESDVTPTGAMGKIMQLTYGVLIPQNATANLMSAGITAGAASASADLLNDLKSGYLLGANPRRQFIAQFFGLLPGAVATVIGFYVLVPDATALTGKDGGEAAFPAPAAQQWKAVAQVFQHGIGNLHPMARQCIYVGIVVGVALVLLDKALSAENLKRYRAYFPSPMGVGLGLILPFYQILSMFIGALIGAVAESKKDSKAAALVIPIASGLIAGESLVGVIVAGLNNFVLK